MKKVLVVFGTRPEAIKMAPLVKRFQSFPNEFLLKVCVTGQHRQMLDSVLRIFEIEPEYDLDIMQPGQDLFDISSRVLNGMRNILQDFSPALILVHGDTTTSTFAALAAFYKQIPIGHVEAGLRTYDTYSPWPEEMNRQLTARLASFHFTPTKTSSHNLISEGISNNCIFQTGNTVIDALQWATEKLKSTPSLRLSTETLLVRSGLPRKKLLLWSRSVSSESFNYELPASEERRLILVTGHRRENFGEGFIEICQALRSLAKEYRTVDLVYPVHLNPNVRSAIKDVFGDVFAVDEHIARATSGYENIFFIEPLDYLPFIYLMSRSYLILTDSGGIQEEAPGLGKPVLVMRENSERPEAIQSGTAVLVGTKKKRIIREVKKLLDDKASYVNMSRALNPYGDGKASWRIVEKCRSLITA